MRKLLTIAFASLVVGCGAGTPQPTTPPPAPETPAATPSEEAPPPPKGLPDAPAAVPPPPASCAALTANQPGDSSACGADANATLEALDQAAAKTDPIQRDAALAALEPCEAFPHGFVRALRADLAPVECGDALVEPLLAAATPETLRRDLRAPLEGIGLAARLARLVNDPPRLDPPFDKAGFDRFVADKLGSWIKDQALAIQELATVGSKLEGYGQGIVAIESGMADMRFVEVMRNVPIPAELEKETELRDAYYGSLDQALDPRKDRGRDAALVGLRALARVGTVSDPRVDRARALLSKLYGGRRVDALDGLLLPPLAEAQPTTIEQRIASHLPTFYAGFVLRDADPTDPALLRALLARGVPEPMQAKLASAQLPDESRRLYARYLVNLGRLYWRSHDFVKASELTKQDKAKSDEARLLAALAVALEGGPKDAAEMMLRGPLLPQGVGNVADLDAMSQSRSPLAGLAAYDAGFLLQLVPTDKPDAKFWRSVATRFDRAARLLTNEAQKSDARARSKAAKEVAATIR